jgi:hypothetical protein
MLALINLGDRRLFDVSKSENRVNTQNYSFRMRTCSTQVTLHASTDRTSTLRVTSSELLSAIFRDLIIAAQWVLQVSLAEACQKRLTFTTCSVH